MSKKLKVSQLILERNISTQLITKLYNMCANKKLGRDSFTNDSNFVGDITTDYTYDEYITLINEYFPSLRITPKGLYILFEDQNVLNILMEYVRATYPDKNYEGVIKELAFSNSGGENNYGFRQMYKDNTDITKFNEISKLVNCKYLATYEFRGCTNLVSVDLTNIQKLCNQAFYKCYNLEYFNGDNSTNGDLRLPNLISDGLAYPQVFAWIDNNGIYFGPKIKRIMDLGNCTAIGRSNGGNTFAFNTMLEYINPAVFTNITYIHSAFEGCIALIIDDLKLPRVSTIDYRSFYRTQVKKISELGPCNIGEQAFRGCTSLTEITQEALNNILSIGTGAFYYCGFTIDDLILPNVTSIGEWAFEGCIIKKISNLGNATTVNGFKNQSLLSSVNLPATATTLGDEAFYNCANLQTINIDNIVFFGDSCLAGINTFKNILYLPKVTTSIAYRAFRNTSSIRSIYLPHAKHTNGTSGYSVPQSVDNMHRGNNTFYCGRNMSIMYFKDIQKINGGVFGGRSWMGRYYLDIIFAWYTSGFPDNYQYAHIENGNIIREFRGNLQIPIIFNSNSDGSIGQQWANIKYLVINNTTPPTYWMSYSKYGDNEIYGEFGLYGKTDSGDNESFHYLVVPRSAINTYLAWDAFHPDLSSPNLPEAERQNILAQITFNNDDPNNPRIIAIESMGHFATKAQYDAAPEKPDGVHNKEEYLIEEYMDLTTPIQWDATPTWSV